MNWRALLYLYMVLIAWLPVKAIAEPLDLSAYQEKDGAIVTWRGSGVVDPYFATKALLMAADAGLSIEEPAKAWIAWLLPRQQSNGLFNRYKYDPDKGWQSYDAADADDALLALWIELLYRLAPPGNMSSAWKISIKKAETGLSVLYAKESGIYHVSSTLAAGLLMDNLEIYASFQRIAKEQRRIGLSAQAKDYIARANRLRQDLLNVFRPDKDKPFLISTQPRKESEFYPDKVAQLFSLFYGLEDRESALHEYRNWIRSNRKEWLSRIRKNYPMGLLAVIALSLEDTDTASCWRNIVLRNHEDILWNVMEESALQQIQWQLRKTGDEDGTACIDGDTL
ncbi:MAG: hypothetical protein KGJ06_02725 [Pseudomonadota bacterium]|nr:hypothetical protein [Pseudomonadota bacterium]